MRIKYLVIAIIGTVLLFSQCSTEESETEKTEMTPEELAEIDQQLEHIKMLNKELTAGKAQDELVVATALFNASSEFVNSHPDHEKTPAVMELAAKSSEIMGKPQQAINIMQKLVDEFPVTADTPKYMANIARIYESMGDIEKAKETYNQLIEKFPEDPFAMDAQIYMDNILGKSHDDLLIFLDTVNSQ